MVVDGDCMSALLLLLSAAFFGAGITASILSRKYKKQVKQQSDYWKSYWYDHFYEIRQTGLTKEQMERMHALYVDNAKRNDL